MKQELGESFVGLFTDPGEVHTGYVLVRIHPRKFGIIESGEVRGADASADLIDRAVLICNASLWVYEGFRLYAHKKDVKTWSEFPEVETIGAMRQAARPYRPALQIHKQYASEIKIPPFEDAKLRAMGLDYRKVMPSNHTRDAFRHFLCFWCFKLKRGYPRIIDNMIGEIAVAREC